jgi:hypothetical protein
MSRKATDSVSTLGIDIGKNTFHLIGLNTEGGHRTPAEALPRPGTGAADNPTAMPNWHGGLRRGAPSQPAALGARP